MRVLFPGGFENAARLAPLAAFGEQPARQRRGRHEFGRKLRGIDRERARRIAVLLLGRERTRGEQHGALAPVCVAVDHAGRAMAFEDRERALPVARRAAEFEHRLSGPGQRRRILGGLLGGEPRRDRIVAALRLDIEPAQAEQPRILTLRHGAERVLGARAVAIELRGLRAQQQRERRARQALLGIRGVALRGARIARADRDQPARDRIVAPAALALAHGERKQLRRAQQETEQRPQQDRRDRDREDRHHGHHHGGVGAVAEPGDGDLPGPVGEPHDAERKQSCRDEEDENADHARIAPHGAALPSVPTASSASLRAAASAAICACARLIHPSAGARTAGGRAAKLGRRAAKIATRRLRFGARHDRCGVIARRLADRADAHQPLGILLHAIEETFSARRAACGIEHRSG